METRRKPQLLLSLIVLSALFSQMLAWPLVEARFVRVPLVEENELDRPDTDIFQDAFPENGRKARHANEIFNRDFSRLLDDLSDKPEAFNEKRDLDNIAENERPVKRQMNSIHSDLFLQHQRRIAVRKYLESLYKNQRKKGKH